MTALIFFEILAFFLDTIFNQRENMNKLRNKKVGLALGGGAVLGAVHVGVLKAFEELNIEIKVISGTSVGALVASLYAFGKSAKEIENIVLKFGWKDLSSFAFSKYAILSNQRIGNTLTKHIGDKTFKEANIPLFIIATNISNGEKVVLSEGSVSNAVIASTCVPGIFVPIEIDGKLLVDGGIVENIPLSCLKDKDVDFLIGVDLVLEEFYKKPKNVIEVLYNSFNILVKTNKKIQTKEADIIIKPDLKDFNPTDMSQIKDLIELGYNETKKIITNL